MTIGSASGKQIIDESQSDLPQIFYGMRPFRSVAEKVGRPKRNITKG
jgi:hypothetical protein